MITCIPTNPTSQSQTLLLLQTSSSVDTYRKMGEIKIESDKIYKIAVNGIDTTIQIKNNNNIIFIGYKDYDLRPENIQNSTPGKENIDFEKSRHKIIVSLEKSEN